MNTLDSTLNFQQQALRLSSQRQELVASNIANADTPNYKAQDLNFAQALERAEAGSSAGTLATTAVRHIATPLAAPPETGDSASFGTAPQPSLDGNTVDMDTQRAQFAEATMHYQAAFTFLNGQIKTILTALQG